MSDRHVIIAIPANTYQSMKSKPVKANLIRNKKVEEFKGNGVVYIDFDADNYRIVFERYLHLLKKGKGTVATFNLSNIIGIWFSDSTKY